MINKQRKSIIKLKEKGKRQAMKKKWTEPGGHNRGPLKQSYYWVSDKLMDYPLEELFWGAMF